MDVPDPSDTIRQVNCPVLVSRMSSAATPRTMAAMIAKNTALPHPVRCCVTVDVDVMAGSVETMIVSRL